MALGFTISENAGIRYLAGTIDEMADFDALLAVATDPLVLNLSRVRAINSLGLRRLINFTRAMGERALEFHECPTVFIEAVNVIPLAVGGQSKIHRIKSLHLPFSCEDEHERHVTLPLAAVQFDRASGDVVIPEVRCPVCAQVALPVIESDLEEFFFFLAQAEAS